MSKKANPSPPAPLWGPLSLLVLGLAESGLALFQWSQLLTLRRGGPTVCGLSESINCEAVWNTPFASAVHELLRVPVAGLGLVWGIAAVALSAMYLAWARSGQPVRPATNGLRLVAAAGVASTVVFAAVSATAGALCPTCVATYALVLAFAAVAWRGLPGPLLPQPGEWGRALQWTGGFTLAAWLAVLGPGLSTPKATSAQDTLPQATHTVAPGSLEAWLLGLPREEQQHLSNALAFYKMQSPRPALAAARRLWGPVDAPVKVVEWTDSKCPHCKHLVEELSVLKQRLPAGKLSLEARQFPLDRACNSSMPPHFLDGTGVRCLAAKAQICLEEAAEFWELRERLFAAQASLDPARVLEIASSGSVSRERLQACIDSPDTTRKLEEDMRYAEQHNLTGTPLVVINGRKAEPLASLLYALAVADGDANAAAFRVLPPPDLSHAHRH